MLWIRKSFTFLFSIILFALLLGLVGATTFTMYLSKPDHIDGWLASSRLYDHFVDGVIEQSKHSTGGEDNSSVSLSDTAVQQAAHSAFSSELIQKSVNSFLDGNYAWLKGETKTPEFNIDLSSAKQQFATQVGQYVTGYLKNLPTCTDAQLATITDPNQDPLSLSCRPAQLDPQAEGAHITDQLANSSEFLGTPKLTQDTITAGGQASTPYYSKLSALPKVYRIAAKLPLIITGLIALFSLAIIFIAPRKRAGIRRIGVVFIVAGVTLLIEKLVADSLVKRVNLDKLKLFNSDVHQSSGPLQDSLTSFVHRAESALTRFDVYFGVVFLLIGAGIITILIVKRRQGSGPSGSSVTTAAAPKDSKPQTPAAAARTAAADAFSATANKANRTVRALGLKPRNSSPDITPAKPVVTRPKPAQPKPAVPAGKSAQPKFRKPPRLIQ
jgi:hypothetical protein